MRMKPCPFCARENIEVVKFHDTCYCVACNCGAEAPGNSVSENGAIRIWNRRRTADIEWKKYLDALGETFSKYEQGEKKDHIVLDDVNR